MPESETAREGMPPAEKPAKPERKPRQLYKIEYYDERIDKWVLNYPFSCMQKSFAEGAWSMLRAFYNHRHKYRLVCGAEVVEEMKSKQAVGVA